MSYSSCSACTCSSTSHHRLIAIISILLLNPLPLVDCVPTEKRNANTRLLRQKRQTDFNNGDMTFKENTFSQTDEINFEGLLGCKYDPSVCKRNEICFDDELFGQCWNGKGSSGKALVLNNGVDGIRNDQLMALELTRHFLSRYHLDWTDYMTQCILLRILTDHHELNRNSLELFYNDCLNQDELLDEFTEKQQENNIKRRQTKKHTTFYHKDPYSSFFKSGNLFHAYDNSFGVPSFMKDNKKSRIQGTPKKQVSIHSNNEDLVLKEKPIEFIAEESSMNEPAKVSMHIKETHPGLTETLKINSNKQLLKILSSETLRRNNVTYNNGTVNTNDAERYFLVESTHGYIVINRDFENQKEGVRLLELIAEMNLWPVEIFTEVNVDRHLLTFYVLDNVYQINASSVASSVLNHQKTIENRLDIHIIDSGFGNPNQGTKLAVEQQNGSRLAIVTWVTCLWILFIMCSFVLLYLMKRNDRILNKMTEIIHQKDSSSGYSEYFRQLIIQPTATTTTTTSGEVQKTSSLGTQTVPVNSKAKRISEVSSSRSSTSAYADESATSLNVDIMVGHLILSYVEDHLCNRNRLESEWESFCANKLDDEQATISCSVALLEMNEHKNRYMDCIPYDHNRVQLASDDNSDYINASTIFDSDPKCKYIATQGPMSNTTNAFWQMVWEQGSCVIVALTRPIENGITMCHHYWPVEGSIQYDDFEVNLVSEHIYSDDYVVRNFYFANIQTMETRTITQFHFLTWDELCNPPSTKAILDFRRKVNKCCRGTSAPLIVHCNDGVGRTGTYLVLDIVLNCIQRGAREINIPATLEHIRGQRDKMIKTKEQFEFVFSAVAEEATDLLKALSQKD
ncbi:unnamed protein product [Rotaria socialis]|uniref:Receptor-type tyrosine-protein phosphatase N2 n=1 Tax=Rotaria socialis TaxID=392032 RepID=A0A820VQQ9_9BILA|nr:unnamed protein product [Rotaria socialis]CAF4505446.1 unnamed protein product [Rotaria socialis]